jgi:hypothetical protein
MWGDNGSECSKYSVLPTLFFIAEHVRGNTDLALIKKRFKECLGLDFDAFMLLDKPNEIAIPEKDDFPICPSKYMLYCDPFVGFLDSTVRLGEGKKYAEYAEAIKAAGESAGELRYIFDTLSALCLVLADKYELGVRTRAAYQSGDREELLRLANGEYSRIEKNLQDFIAAFERQWLLENKPFGLEVQHQRLGGVLLRIGACRQRLLDYIEGRIDAIPELSEKILTFRKDGESIYYNDHARSATPCHTHPA